MVTWYRAAATSHLRLLAAVPSVRAAVYRESATDIGVAGLAVISTGTTAATTLAGVSFAGPSGITPTASGLLLNANCGLAFVVDASQAREFALAHWLVGGADGGCLFVRCSDGAKTLLTDAEARVLASGATMSWNSAAKAWIAVAGAVPGDVVQVGFSVASTAVVFLGTIAAVASNRSGAAIDLAAARFSAGLEATTRVTPDNAAAGTVIAKAPLAVLRDAPARPFVHPTNTTRLKYRHDDTQM